jgi:hypothetical protein
MGADAELQVQFHDIKGNDLEQFRTMALRRYSPRQNTPLANGSIHLRRRGKAAGLLALSATLASYCRAVSLDAL